MNSTGNVSIEHGNTINSISNVLVASILDMIMNAQNTPAKYAYALAFVTFSNIKSPKT